AVQVLATDGASAELELEAEDLGALAQLLQLGRVEPLDPRVVTDLEDLAPQLGSAIDHPGDAQGLGIALGQLPEQGIGSDADLHALFTPSCASRWSGQMRAEAGLRPRGGGVRPVLPGAGVARGLQGRTRSGPWSVRLMHHGHETQNWSTGWALGRRTTAGRPVLCGAGDGGLLGGVAWGRSAVRVASSSLAVRGIVGTRAGSGTYLRSGTSELLPRTLSWWLLLDQNRTSELTVVRCALERSAAELAAA